MHNQVQVIFCACTSVCIYVCARMCILWSVYQWTTVHVFVVFSVCVHVFCCCVLVIWNIVQWMFFKQVTCVCVNCVFFPLSLLSYAFGSINLFLFKHEASSVYIKLLSHGNFALVRSCCGIGNWNNDAATKFTKRLFVCMELSS